jgi:hypothetical protein
MSDPTKKSIVINKSFLSGSVGSSSLHTQNKKYNGYYFVKI